MAAVGLVLAWVAAASLSAQRAGDRDVFVIDTLQEPVQAPRAGARGGQAQGRGIIRGTVTSIGTGVPVRGATVRANFGSGDAPPQTAVTDDNGAFALTGLAPGSWLLNAGWRFIFLDTDAQNFPLSDGSTPGVTTAMTVYGGKFGFHDVIIPEGGENEIAIDMIASRVRLLLGPGGRSAG